MYWLARPPYSRWVLAGLLVACALYLDMRSTPVSQYPFAAEPIRVGEPVEASLEWRDVPSGVLPDWVGAVTGVAVGNIATGTPLVPSLTSRPVIPADWWSVSLPLPYPIAPGTRVRVAAGDAIIEGIVAGAMADSGFDLSGPVAFPADQASIVAAAAANSAIVVMIGAAEPTAQSSG